MKLAGDTRVRAACALLAWAVLGSSCGRQAGNPADGQNGRDAGGPRSLQTVKLPDFPHSIDVYAVDGADRAFVMLHGGGGNNRLSANDLGLNATTDAPTQDSVDWAWLSAHRVVAVFPQGQSLASAPNAFTWSNRVMDSGQDDIAFLQALAQYIRKQFQVSKVYLIGHSNGGMMANRMWCESPATFDAYAAISGPASSDYLDASTPCAPDVVQPYFGIIGDMDNVLQVPGNWEATTWEINATLEVLGAAAFVNPVLIGEWHQQQARTQTMCGETLALSDAVSDGSVETWSSCGARLKLQRVLQGGHPIATLEAAAGYRMLDVLFDFFDALGSVGA